MLQTTQLRRALASDVAVVLGLALAPVVTLGFSRFAYALLLPAMREDLAWSYTRAGGMNTANAAGYIVGAATGAWFAKRLGIRAAFMATLAISALALVATATTGSYDALLLIRAAGGMATAIAFVLGSSLAARLRPALLPVYFMGVGLGIVLSGVVVPAALAGGSPGDWRLGWVLLGIASLVALVPAHLASRAVPDQQAAPAASLTLGQLRRLGPTFVAYTLFGAGYVSYMTFVIALLRDGELASWVPFLFWLVLGASSAALIGRWGRHFATARGGNGVAAVSAVVLAGTLPVLLDPGPVAALVSAVVFGSSFMAGPTAVTALTRRVLEPGAWTAGIAAMTTAFAVGQAVGPVLSGVLADGSGGLQAGLWLSPVLLAAAALAAWLQVHHPHHGTIQPKAEVDWR